MPLENTTILQNTVPKPPLPAAQQAGPALTPTSVPTPVTAEEKGPEELGVLYITDKKELFDTTSPDRAILLEYAKRIHELHVVVLTNNKNTKQIEQIAPNAWLYPTNDPDAVSAIFSVPKLVAQHCVWQTKLRANLIVATNPLMAGFVAIRLAKKYKKRVFLEYKRDYLTPVSKLSLLDFIARKTAEEVVRKSTRVLLGSARLRGSVVPLLPKGEEQITTVPTFVDVEAINKSADRVNFFEKYPGIMFMMVTACELIPDQDVDLLLECMNMLVRDYPKTGLLILGDGPEKEKLERRVKHMALDHNVFFESMPGNVIPYFRGANLYLSAARVDDENLGAVQALAASAPVVVTTANSVASVLAGTPYASYVCPVGDMSCILTKITGFIKNVGLREDFRINAKYLIEGKMKGFAGNHYDFIIGEWKKTFLYKQ